MLISNCGQFAKQVSDRDLKPPFRRKLVIRVKKSACTASQIRSREWIAREMVDEQLSYQLNRGEPGDNIWLVAVPVPSGAGLHS